MRIITVEKYFNPQAIALIDEPGYQKVLDRSFIKKMCQRIINYQGARIIITQPSWAQNIVQHHLGKKSCD
jgi:hypothetical protein